MKTTISEIGSETIDLSKVERVSSVLQDPETGNRSYVIFFVSGKELRVLDSPNKEGGDLPFAPRTDFLKAWHKASLPETTIDWQFGL